MSLALANRHGGRTTEKGLYHVVGALLSGEIVQGFRVYQNDPLGMSVLIGGEDDIEDSALIRNTSFNYPFVILNEDGQPIEATVTTAHATNPRRDLVILYVDMDQARDQAYPNNTNDVVKAVVVAGTPAAEPTLPSGSQISDAIGAGNFYIILAELQVAAMATTVTDGVIIDNRDYVIGAAPSLRNETVYTSSSTWNKPAEMSGKGYVIVEVVGGGGGGGGAAATSSAQSALGGSGGGGGYSRERIEAVDLGSSVAVTVGAAGAASATGNNAGGNGGTSSFGSHCSANGGAGGTGSATLDVNIGKTGGAGGTATGGDINIQGEPGQTGTIVPPRAAGGNGGSSMYGRGGIGLAGGATVSSNGSTGQLYGGGGSGGINGQSQATARAGGAGAAGVVIVREYY